MSDIALPPPLTHPQVQALARAFLCGEAFVPANLQDPRMSTLLKVVLRFIHEQIAAGKTEAEWDRFQAQVVFILNPKLESTSIIPPCDMKIILRKDFERVAALVRPLMEFPGLEKPQEAGYG